jgi:hypothetical protein
MSARLRSITPAMVSCSSAEGVSQPISTHVTALPSSRERASATAGRASSTGRLEKVLTAWGRGHLAEVPAGLGFDVLRTPGSVAADTVRLVDPQRLHDVLAARAAETQRAVQ